MNSKRINTVIAWIIVLGLLLFNGIMSSCTPKSEPKQFVRLVEVSSYTPTYKCDTVSIQDIQYLDAPMLAYNCSYFNRTLNKYYRVIN